MFGCGRVHVRVCVDGGVLSTILKTIQVGLREVKSEFLFFFFKKQAKAEAIICERRRKLLAPVRFDFSGRNWISGH